MLFIGTIIWNQSVFQFVFYKIPENRKQYATLNDRPGSLRAKPGWFSDLITPYEGFAEGPPRALGNIVKASAWYY